MVQTVGPPHRNHNQNGHTEIYKLGSECHSVRLFPFSPFLPPSVAPSLPSVCLCHLSVCHVLRLCIYLSIHLSVLMGHLTPPRMSAHRGRSLGTPWCLMQHSAPQEMWVGELCLLSERAVLDGRQHSSGAQMFPYHQQVDSRTRVSLPCDVLFWHLYLRVLLKLKTDHTSGYTETKIQVFPFRFVWFRKPISN